MSVYCVDKIENELDGDFLTGAKLTKEDEIAVVDLGIIDERESLIYLTKVFDEYENEQKNRELLTNLISSLQNDKASENGKKIGRKRGEKVCPNNGS